MKFRSPGLGDLPEFICCALPLSITREPGCGHRDHASAFIRKDWLTCPNCKRVVPLAWQGKFHQTNHWVIRGAMAQALKLSLPIIELELRP